eukprot:7616436-Heterocapsa_arctica.AAC.1
MPQTGKWLQRERIARGLARLCWPHLEAMCPGAACGRPHLALLCWDSYIYTQSKRYISKHSLESSVNPIDQTQTLNNFLHTWPLPVSLRDRRPLCACPYRGKV